MDINERDDEVIKLLTQIKSAESAYPADMMASRRQAYQKQIAALGIGMGAAGALGHTLKSAGRGFTLPPVAGTIIESILVVAIVAEAAAAYVNRDKIRNLFRTISQQSAVEKVEEASEPSVESVVPTIELVLTSTTQLTETVTPVDTPSPELLLAPDVTAADASGNSEQVIATPKVTDKNGNQYGLTPKPERTKEPANGNPADGSPADGDQNKNPKKKP